MFGVLIPDVAVKPGRSPHPMSSVKMRTMFGRFVLAANVIFERTHAAAMNPTQNIFKGFASGELRKADEKKVRHR